MPVRRAAQTSAAVADGPARPIPQSFKVESKLPQRYVIRQRWEDVRPEQRLPLVARLNERAFKQDPRVKKVTISMGSEAGAVLIADSLGGWWKTCSR